MAYPTALVAQRMGAFFGLTGVILGAFAAHSLKPVLLKNGMWDVWQTGVFYQFVHALALLIVGQSIHLRFATMAFWSMGVILFSGSLYFLAIFPSQHWIGPVTPLGGTLLIAGWGCLLWDLRHRKKTPQK